MQCIIEGDVVSNNGRTCQVHHKKTDVKVFAVAIQKEGWAFGMTPILKYEL